MLQLFQCLSLLHVGLSAARALSAIAHEPADLGTLVRAPARRKIPLRRGVLIGDLGGSPLADPQMER